MVLPIQLGPWEAILRLRARIALHRLSVCIRSGDPRWLTHVGVCMEYMLDGERGVRGGSCGGGLGEMTSRDDLLDVLLGEMTSRDDLLDVLLLKACRATPSGGLPGACTRGDRSAVSEPSLSPQCDAPAQASRVANDSGHTWCRHSPSTFHCELFLPKASGRGFCSPQESCWLWTRQHQNSNHALRALRPCPVAALSGKISCRGEVIALGRWEVIAFSFLLKRPRTFLRISGLWPITTSSLYSSVFESSSSSATNSALASDSVKPSFGPSCIDRSIRRQSACEILPVRFESMRKKISTARGAPLHTRSNSRRRA